MIDRIRFAQTLKEYNIELTEKQMDQLDKYAEILVEYNEKVNLTAITDPLGIENKHFLDQSGCRHTYRQFQMHSERFSICCMRSEFLQARSA